jgi:hypothetical protein
MACAAIAGVNWRLTDKRVSCETQACLGRRCALIDGGRNFSSRHSRARAPAPHELSPHNSLCAIRFRAGEGYVIALAVEADDEHGTPMAVATGLVGSKNRCIPALRCGVADALAEAAVAKFVGATKEFDGVVGVVGSERGLHGAVMLIAKREDVRPHSQASLADR